MPLTLASPIAKRAAAACDVVSYTVEEVIEEVSFVGTVTSTARDTLSVRHETLSQRECLVP
jgi:hypothetical protein